MVLSNSESKTLSIPKTVSNGLRLNLSFRKLSRIVELRRDWRRMASEGGERREETQTRQEQWLWDGGKETVKLRKLFDTIY